MAQKFNFKRLEEPFEADWPVTVNVPADGGKILQEEFTARFRLIRDVSSHAELAAAEIEAAVELPTDGEELSAERKAEIVAKAKAAVREATIARFREWFVGFGKPTADEQELTDDVLWDLVTTPYVRNALHEAYQRFRQGIAVKN